MKDDQGGSKPSDPFEALRGMRDAYLGVLSKSMIDAVNSESYAQANGAMLESYLAFATPMRESLDKAMQSWLEQMSLPSRQDVAVLAERFTHIEMRLDDMDAKCNRILELISAAGKSVEPIHAPEERSQAEPKPAASATASNKTTHTKAASEASPSRRGVGKG
jgi:hypothetical protein